MTRIVGPTLFTIAALVGAAVHAPAGADHDRARQAVREGQILELSEILARVERDFPGELIEVELEADDDADDDGADRLLYEIELLRPDGNVTELTYDAATGELLRARGHDLEDDDARGDDDEDDGEWD